MKIEEISIKNYRSIKDEIVIKTKPIAKRSCFTILGINESGKSNILKSISLLAKDAKFEYSKDCNKDTQKMSKDNLISLTFNLKLETEKYKEELVSKIDEKIINSIKITDLHRKVSIDKTNVRKDFYHIWIKDSKIFSAYAINNTTKEIKEIKSIYTGVENIVGDNVKQFLGNDFDILNKEILENLLQDNLFSFFDINLPRVIFWEPRDEYLITKPIDLNIFKDNQSISIPLRNIFWLSGIKDNIRERIDISLKEMGGKAELEKELGKNATAYINDIWPEHKINIIVRIENTLCEVYIEDKDKVDTYHNMLNRSDGFRQFITIAFNLASENKSESLKNSIILLDEPETHLHPSGIKYLREVLLKISENNIVFIATHSPYMIDKINLERNISVFKEKSLTRIKNISKDNPYEEEVIYEALGTSIYEFVSPNALILEGKTDKDILDMFMRKFSLKQNFDTISADSADKIPYYTKFFNGKRTKGFVIVDSDSKGKKIKEQVIKNGDGYSNSNVFEINDIVSVCEDSTLEDLLPTDLIILSVKQLYNYDVLVDSKKPIMIQLIFKLKDSRLIGNSQKDETEMKIKQKIMENIKKEISELTTPDLEKKYKKYINFAKTLHEKVK